MAGSAVIGSLRVNLGLDSAAFSSGLKKSQGQFAAFSKSMATGAVAAVGGLLSVTAAINGTRAALEKFGKINDLSIGAGLDPQVFQSLAHTASLAGVSIEETGAALATFAKSSGQAEAGTGRMAAQLQKLNPELLTSIQAASTQEQRFRLVADALSKIEDPATRAAVATAAFGETGGKIADAFKGGSAAIDLAMRKAQEMGIIVSRDLISRADELGDKFDTATQIVDVQMKAAFINLAPWVVRVAEAAGEFTRLLAIGLDHLNTIENRQFETPLKNQMAEVTNARITLGEEIKKLEQQVADGAAIPVFTDLLLASSKGTFDRLTEKALAIQERLKQLQIQQTPPPATDVTLGDLPPIKPPGAIDTKSAKDGLASLREEMQALKVDFQNPFENLQMELDHLGAMLNASPGDWETFSKAAWAAKMEAGAALAEVASTVSGTLAGIFKDSKAFAVADIAISTAQGAMKALATSGPFGWIQAAAITAAGVAQAAAVVSATPGGSSRPAMVGRPAAGVVAPDGIGAGAGTGVNITLQGDTHSTQSVRDLFEQLQDYLGDQGKRISVSAI